MIINGVQEEDAAARQALAQLAARVEARRGGQVTEINVNDDFLRPVRAEALNVGIHLQLRKDFASRMTMDELEAIAVRDLTRDGAKLTLGNGFYGIVAWGGLASAGMTALTLSGIGAVAATAGFVVTSVAFRTLELVRSRKVEVNADRQALGFGLDANVLSAAILKDRSRNVVDRRAQRRGQEMRRSRLASLVAYNPRSIRVKAIQHAAAHQINW